METTRLSAQAVAEPGLVERFSKLREIGHGTVRAGARCSTAADRGSA